MKKNLGNESEEPALGHPAGVEIDVYTLDPHFRTGLDRPRGDCVGLLAALWVLLWFELCEL